MNLNALDEMTLPLEVSQFYHIYNEGNNRGDIFFNEDNYLLFLKEYSYFLSDYVDTYAFCLLSNHFHLLIKVKDEKEFKEVDYNNVPIIVGNQFRLFFKKYAETINKQENIKGSLFKKIFRRKRIDAKPFLKSLICYINSNAIKHGISSDMGSYKWSSYRIMISEKPTNLKRMEILDLFGGESSFVEAIQSDEIKLQSKPFWIEI